MSNMVVATNVMALNSHRALKGVSTAQSRAAARLSSGYRINSAADDAAGLAISEKMRAQIRGLDMASRNSQDAISLIQTAEGGMQEIDNMIQRIRELTVQAANDTNENNRAGTGDRQKIQDEINQLVAEIDSMAERVEFNRKRLINGDFSVPQELVDLRRMQLTAANERLAVTTIDRARSLQTLATANEELRRFEGNTLDGNEFSLMQAAEAVLRNSQSARTAVNDLNNAAASLREFFINLGAPEELMQDQLILDGATPPALVNIDIAGSVPVAPPALSGAGEITVWQLDHDDTTIFFAIGTQVFSRTGHAGFATDMIDRLDDLIAELEHAQDEFATAQTDFLDEMLIALNEATSAFAVLDPTHADGSQVNRHFQAYQLALTNFLKADFLGPDLIRELETEFNVLEPGNPGNPTTISVADMENETGEELILALARKLQRAKVDFLNAAPERQHLELTNQLQTARSGLEVTTLNANMAMAGVDRSTAALIDAQRIAVERSANSLYFQVGANAYQGINMSIGSIKSDILGIGDGLGNTNIDVVRDSGRDITGILNVLDEALSYVSTERSKLGAAQNRMEHTIRSLDISSVNLSASESRIRDADMAREMMAFTQANVLNQAAISMLAQANQAPQMILQLLG